MMLLCLERLKRLKRHYGICKEVVVMVYDDWDKMLIANTIMIMVNITVLVIIGYLMYLNYLWLKFI